MPTYRELLQETDREVFAAIAGEERRQRRGIELIPSENYTYPEVLAALGSVFTNKYSEGYPGAAITAARSTPTSSRRWPARGPARCSAATTPTSSRYRDRR